MNNYAESEICDNADLIEESIKMFGVNNQIDKTLEELAELTLILHRFKKENSENYSDPNELKTIISEIKLERFDVGVMLKDLDIIFNFNEHDATLLSRKQFAKLKHYIARASEI